MSNKSTLQEHNTQLQDNIDLIQQAIDKAKELPDASSGGSAATETCTLRFECNTSTKGVETFICGHIFYPTITENGDIVWEAYHPEETERSITIENVVVNQFIRFECDVTEETIGNDLHAIAYPSYTSFAKELTEDIFYSYFYFICTEANETSLVEINAD